MVKRFFSLLSALLLTMGCAAAETAVAPDFIIMSCDNFYDRQTLADYISRLF